MTAPPRRQSVPGLQVDTQSESTVVGHLGAALRKVVFYGVWASNMRCFHFRRAQHSGDWVHVIHAIARPPNPLSLGPNLWRVSRAAIIEPAARRACVNIRVSNTDRSRDGRCAGSAVHAAQRAQGWAIVSESAGASVRRGGAEQGQGQGCLHGTLERDRMRRFTAARGLDVGQGARQHVLGARRPYRTPTAAPSAMVRALRLFFAITLSFLLSPGAPTSPT